MIILKWRPSAADMPHALGQQANGNVIRLQQVGISVVLEKSASLFIDTNVLHRSCCILGRPDASGTRNSQVQINAHAKCLWLQFRGRCQKSTDIKVTYLTKTLTAIDGLQGKSTASAQNNATWDDCFPVTVHVHALEASCTGTCVLWTVL